MFWSFHGTLYFEKIKRRRQLSHLDSGKSVVVPFFCINLNDYENRIDVFGHFLQCYEKDIRFSDSSKPYFERLAQ